MPPRNGSSCAMSAGRMFPVESSTAMRSIRTTCTVACGRARRIGKAILGSPRRRVLATRGSATAPKSWSRWLVGVGTHRAAFAISQPVSGWPSSRTCRFHTPTPRAARCAAGSARLLESVVLFGKWSHASQIVPCLPSCKKSASVCT